MKIGSEKFDTRHQAADVRCYAGADIGYIGRLIIHVIVRRQSWL